MYSRNALFVAKPGVDALEKLLARNNAIMDLSGSASFWRGQEYFKLGRVSTMNFENEALVVWVNGSNGAYYKTEMRLEKGALEYSCTCPVGQTRRFCKHLVAAALAFLACAKIPERETRKYFSVKSKIEFAKAVERMPHEELAERFVRLAERQWHMRFEIALQDAKHIGSSFLIVKTLRAAFSDAVLRESFCQEEVEGESAELFLTALRSLIAEGYCKEVVAVCTSALNKAKTILYDYETMNFPTETFREILLVLLDASAKVQPPDTRLSRRLVQWALNDTYKIFADILLERMPDFPQMIRKETERRAAQKAKRSLLSSKRPKKRKRRKKPVFNGHGLI